MDHTARTVEEMRDEFAIECQNVVESTSRKGFHFICSVDGSEISHLGFDLCLSLRKKYDYISLFHAYKSNQTDVPDVFKASTILSNYEGEVGRHLSSSQSQFLWEDRRGRSVVDTLKASIAECKNSGNPPHFLVLGHLGRKQGKGRQEKGYFAPMSSNCDWILRTIQLPCLIAKKPCTHRREGKTWVMAVDGTLYSDRGLDILLSLVRPRDTLRLFYIFSLNENAEYSEYMKEHYEQELLEYGPAHSEFVLVEQERGKDLQHALTDYVNQLEPDIFVLAPRARETLTLSPITDYVINNVSSSVFVCKN
jgi:nucleotide-binding universal stress UspA family protein